MNPVNTGWLFEDLISRFPGTAFEFHGHNDLGMATANAFAAIEAGANFVSGTGNGLGERAGNMAIEELITAFSFSAKMTLPYKMETLNALCRRVADASGIAISRSKPVVGEAVFMHESGIHCRSMLKNRMSYQAFLPEKVGRKRETFSNGKHSGKAALSEFFRKMKVEPGEETLEKLQNMVKEEAMRLKRALEDKELIQIYAALMSDNKNSMAR